MLTTEAKLAVIKEYATHEGDTGSPEVQVAILTSRIQYLTDHLNHKCFKLMTPFLPFYIPIRDIL